MRSANVTLGTVACASGRRQFQASSKAIFITATVEGSKRATFATEHLFDLARAERMLSEREGDLTNWNKRHDG
jgi:hypothetical protein